MSFIKIPPRDPNITQDNPLYYTYETSQSMEINFDVVNDAGQVLVSSNNPRHYHKFDITVDQLEGEINVPFQYIDKFTDYDQETGSYYTWYDGQGNAHGEADYDTQSAPGRVERRLIIPNSFANLAFSNVFNWCSETI